MAEQHPKFKFVFLAIDIVVLTISYFSALFWCFSDTLESVIGQMYFGVSYLLLYVLFLGSFIYSFRFNCLYYRNILVTRYRQFILTATSLLYGSLACTIILVVFNVNYFSAYGKRFIWINFLLNIAFFVIVRGLFGKSIFLFLRNKDILTQRVLIVGSAGTAISAAESLKADKISQFVIVGFLDDYLKKGESITGHYNNLGNLKDLDDLIKEHDINEILIAIEHSPYERLITIVEACLATHLPVRIHSDLTDVIVKKMKTEYYASIPVVVLSQKPIESNAWVDKRTFDILLSAAALVILSPLFLAIAVGIKLSSKGPVLYKQIRIGKDGKPFDFYKFRSMHLHNDDSAHQKFVTDFIKQNGKNTIDGNDDDLDCRLKEKEINVFKIKDDPRIFAFGKFIRKTSLDELPQLYNVLKGDMTLVGPRPCLPYEWDCYEGWHKNRLKAIPGCTGIWQTLGRSSVTFEDMVILDLFYISNMSLWLDFQIVMRTFPVIFLGKGGF